MWIYLLISTLAGILAGMLLRRQNQGTTQKFVRSANDQIRYSFSVACLEAYMRRTWELLGRSGPNGWPLRIAVFGGGKHTHWLYRLVTSRPVDSPPVVTAILDDHPESAQSCWNAPVVRPEAFDPSTVEMIFISSDTQSMRMLSICHAYYANRIKIFNPYEEFPPGPYDKTRDVASDKQSG